MVGCQQAISDGSWLSAGHQWWLVVNRSPVMFGCQQVTSGGCCLVVVVASG